MGHAGTRLSQQIDIRVVEVHTMGQVDVATQPLVFVQKRNRPLAELLEAVFLLVERFSGVRVQQHAFVAGQRLRVAQ